MLVCWNLSCTPALIAEGRSLSRITSSPTLQRMVLAFFCKKAGQSFQKNCCLWGCASAACTNQRCKCTMIYFSYSLAIFQPLLGLVLFVERSQTRALIRRRKWVKNPNIKICAMLSVPERFCSNVHPRVWILVR